MNGVIVIDKEKGITSRDVVNRVVKEYNTKKVGHTGTLDPIATGVLVVCVGSATKLVSELTNHDKEYIATVELGVLTDTLDITGNIIKKEDVNITKEEILEVLNSFKGKYIQEVPIYSAVKVRGKKLYEYARSNEYVELPKREVEIYSIELLDYKDNHFTFKCSVSKGTYIRALINDIATKLGTIGIMTDLRRTRLGKFTLDDCSRGSISIKDVLDIPVIELDKNIEKKVLNGAKIDDIYNSDKILFVKDNIEIAIYEKGKPYIMFKGGNI
jgi:tRNA pseudouridine55 synthase